MIYKLYSGVSSKIAKSFLSLIFSFDIFFFEESSPEFNDPMTFPLKSAYSAWSFTTQQMMRPFLSFKRQDQFLEWSANTGQKLVESSCCLSLPIFVNFTWDFILYPKIAKNTLFSLNRQKRTHLLNLKLNQSEGEFFITASSFLWRKNVRARPYSRTWFEKPWKKKIVTLEIIRTSAFTFYFCKRTNV